MLALSMVLSVFMLPLGLTAQGFVAFDKECDPQTSTGFEEEALERVCSFHFTWSPPKAAVGPELLMHQYEEGMLDHPLKEVPHQPPRS